MDNGAEPAAEPTPIMNERARELLPCPFCSEQLISTTNRMGDPYSFHPETSDCPLGAVNITVSPDRPRSVELWNTRALQDRTPVSEAAIGRATRLLSEWLRRGNRHWSKPHDELRDMIATALSPQPFAGMAEEEVERAWEIAFRFFPAKEDAFQAGQLSGAIQTALSSHRSPAADYQPDNTGIEPCLICGRPRSDHNARGWCIKRPMFLGKPAPSPVRRVSDVG